MISAQVKDAEKYSSELILKKVLDIPWSSNKSNDAPQGFSAKLMELVRECQLEKRPGSQR